MEPFPFGGIFKCRAVQMQRDRVKRHEERRPIVPRPEGPGTNNGSAVGLGAESEVELGAVDVRGQAEVRGDWMSAIRTSAENIVERSRKPGGCSVVSVDG